MNVTRQQAERLDNLAKHCGAKIKATRHPSKRNVWFYNVTDAEGVEHVAMSYETLSSLLGQLHPSALKSEKTSY